MMCLFPLYLLLQLHLQLKLLSNLLWLFISLNISLSTSIRLTRLLSKSLPPWYPSLQVANKMIYSNCNKNTMSISNHDDWGSSASNITMLEQRQLGSTPLSSATLQQQQGQTDNGQDYKAVVQTGYCLQGRDKSNFLLQE